MQIFYFYFLINWEDENQIFQLDTSLKHLAIKAATPG